MKSKQQKHIAPSPNANKNPFPDRQMAMAREMQKRAMAIRAQALRSRKGIQ